MKAIRAQAKESPGSPKGGTERAKASSRKRAGQPEPPGPSSSLKQAGIGKASPAKPQPKPSDGAGQRPLKSRKARALGTVSIAPSMGGAAVHSPGVLPPAPLFDGSQFLEAIRSGLEDIGGMLGGILPRALSGPDQAPRASEGGGDASSGNGEGAAGGEGLPDITQEVFNKEIHKRFRNVDEASTSLKLGRKETQEMMSGVITLPDDVKSQVRAWIRDLPLPDLSTPSGEELSASMERMGWKPDREGNAYFGADAQTMKEWTSNETPIPPWAAQLKHELDQTEPMTPSLLGHEISKRFKSIRHAAESTGVPYPVLDKMIRGRQKISPQVAWQLWSWRRESPLADLPTPTPEQLKEMFDRVGFSTAEAAVYFHEVHPELIRQWLNGKKEIPPWAAQLMKKLDRVERITPEILAEEINKRFKTLEEAGTSLNVHASALWKLLNGGDDIRNPLADKIRKLRVLPDVKQPTPEELRLSIRLMKWNRLQARRYFDPNAFMKWDEATPENANIVTDWVKNHRPIPPYVAQLKHELDQFIARRELLGLISAKGMTFSEIASALRIPEKDIDSGVLGASSQPMLLLQAILDWQKQNARPVRPRARASKMKPPTMKPAITRAQEWGRRISILVAGLRISIGEASKDLNTSPETLREAMKGKLPVPILKQYVKDLSGFNLTPNDLAAWMTIFRLDQNRLLELLNARGARYTEDELNAVMDGQQPTLDDADLSWNLYEISKSLSPRPPPYTGELLRRIREELLPDDIRSPDTLSKSLGIPRAVYRFYEDSANPVPLEIAQVISNFLSGTGRSMSGARFALMMKVNHWNDSKAAKELSSTRDFVRYARLLGPHRISEDLLYP